ncbi:arylesterase [Aestuariibius sp. 2305UL40-4]|uniref:arylesterase n=1 Tax=Aestuariibius violaceus TaxID=3234132 RepID=UPI00345EC173
MKILLSGVTRGYGALRCGRNLGTALLISGVIAGGARAEIVVAALGDSLTQGYGLPQDDGFVPQMEMWLRDQGYEVELINAGVSGDTTAGGLARVAWTLTPEVDAMIVALGGNDFLRGIDPAVSRENLAGILEAARAADVEVLMVGLEASSNYGPDYKAAFDSMYPELSDEFGVSLVPSWFDGILAASDSDGPSAFMQPDGIHPNAEGVSVIVDALGPAVVDLVESVSD